MSFPLAAILLLLISLTGGDSSSVALDEFHWSFDANFNRTKLTICSNEPFLEHGDASSVTLVVQVLDTTTELNYLGTLANDSCASFIMNQFVPLPRSEAIYNLVIYAWVDSEQTLVMGETSFSLEVDTTIISCSKNGAITRSIAPLNVVFEDCIIDPSIFGNVCYTDSSTCFTLYDSDPPALRVCLDGSGETLPVSDDDLLSINHLVYSSNNPADATVALDVTGAKPSDETVFWKDGEVQSVSLFSEVPWSAMSFGPSFTEYAVCVVTTDENNSPVTVSTATLTDLDVRVSDSLNTDDEDDLIQLSFINANPESFYRVSVWQFFPSSGMPLQADLLDCSDVDQKNTCYRFMEYAEVEKNVFVAIEYADQIETAVQNMIVVPFNISLLINSTAEDYISNKM